MKFLQMMILSVLLGTTIGVYAQSPIFNEIYKKRTIPEYQIYNNIKKLLEDGTNPNTPNMAGINTIQEAVAWELPTVVKLLVEKGGNPNIPDKDGATPLNMAAKLGHTQSVEALIDAGADLNITDNRGNTPLFNAVLSFLHKGTNSSQIIELLVNAGADKSIRNKAGKTALEQAQAYNNPIAIKALTQRTDKLL